MDARREAAVADLVLQLNDTCDSLLSGSRGCNFACSSIMYLYGALTKQMHSNALLSGSTAPFPNINYKCLVQKVLSFTPPVWYSSNTRRQHNCSD
ncbi:uncharacterized protein BJX67DRAFT_33345 [Aspergillus lucknowensis]|uniref:Uncharacterized protein n=1 Tax=Aspergillus lucknowensis TaxID=176173 RepID=A0ABR4L5J3_9EURO